MELDYAKNLADIFGVEIEDLYEWVNIKDLPRRKRKRKGK
jgi:hypothetical protein